MIRKKILLIISYCTLVLVTGCNIKSMDPACYLDYSKYEKTLDPLKDTIKCYSCDLIPMDAQGVQENHITYDGSKFYCDDIPILDTPMQPVNLKKTHNYEKSLTADQLMSYALTYYANLKDIPMEELENKKLDLAGCKIKYIVQLGESQYYLVPVLIVYIMGEDETTELMIDVNSGGYYAAD